MAFEFRVRCAHLIDDKIRNFVEEEALLTDSSKVQNVVSLVDRSPHDLSQNVTTSFIAWQNSIGNRKCGRTRVISNNAHRKAVLAVCDIRKVENVRYEI